MARIDVALLVVLLTGCAPAPPPHFTSPPRLLPDRNLERAESDRDFASRMLQRCYDASDHGCGFQKDRFLKAQAIWEDAAMVHAGVPLGSPTDLEMFRPAQPIEVPFPSRELVNVVRWQVGSCTEAPPGLRCWILPNVLCKVK